MESITITIHPPEAGDDSLVASEAMQQIVDIVKLIEEASSFVDGPVKWELVRASTNSPLQVEITAVAPLAVALNADRIVATARSRLVDGLASLSSGGTLPAWMGPEGAALTSAIVSRGRDFFGSTDIGNGNGQTVRIDTKRAGEILTTIERESRIFVEVRGDEHAAWGELVGVFLLAGPHYRKPAIKLWTAQYGAVWCMLDDALIKRFGSEHKLSDVWARKTLGVEGRVIYRGDKPTRVVASAIREIPTAPDFDFDSIYDPDFTGGLEPVEYLRRFHEGELAR